jgi:hypothetical protein
MQANEAPYMVDPSEELTQRLFSGRGKNVIKLFPSSVKSVSASFNLCKYGQGLSGVRDI